MKKIITGLMVLASTQFALATVTPTTTIKDMFVYETYVVVKMANKHTNPDSCTKAGADSFIYMSTTGQGGARMYSAILSAYVSGKKVRLGYNLCGTWGTGTIPKAYGVTMVK